MPPFNIEGINDSTGIAIDFGIEICLDHASSSNGSKWFNKYGRIRTANKWVNIQLVPSCGIELQQRSMRLKIPAGPTRASYAFNCDGLATLAYVYNATHTQVWSFVPNCALSSTPDVTQIDATGKLLETNSTEPDPKSGNSTMVKVSDTVSISDDLPKVNASVLWNDGINPRSAGYIRASKVLPL